MSAHQHDLFAGAARMPSEEAVDLTIASLLAYGPRHDTWCVAWSGGKDSTAMLTLLVQLIEDGRVPRPRRLFVLYADTRQELPPLQAAAHALMSQLAARDWIEVEVVRAPMDKRFLVYILGRGVPPPNNRTFRWCTRQIKVDPMVDAIEARLAALDGTVLVINVTDAIERGLSPAALRKIAFDKLADKSREGQVRGTSGNHTRVEVKRDEAVGRRSAMELALTMRVLASRGGDAMDYKPKRKADQRWVEQHASRSADFLGMGFVEIAAECIGHRGNIRTSQQAVNILERAFQSTSDFPAIFQNVLNKVLLARYELAEPTYKLISIERNFKDFRPHPMVRAGEFPMLQPVSQSGELAAGRSADTGESVSLQPYGVVFPITRQMIVNDELGAIDQILGTTGDGARLFENTTFFTMFNANQALAQDGKPVFDSTHKNLAPAGTAITVQSVGNGRAAMRAQRSIANYLLNVPPAIILTGPNQETAADQLVASVTPQQMANVNIFSGKLKSVSDANITDNSWNLIADPNQLPCWVHGFLDGSTGPRVRTYEPFGTQGVQISLEHDFGCGAIDFRGAYRNPGAAPAAQ